MFQAMEANNEFAATLEKRLQDVPRSDELYEIKKGRSGAETRFEDGSGLRAS